MTRPDPTEARMARTRAQVAATRWVEVPVWVELPAPRRMVRRLVEKLRQVA